MARELYDRRYRGTDPVNSRQAYQFGRLNTTVEDSVVAFLRTCFRGSAQPEGRTGSASSEIPEFAKFLRWSTNEEADDASVDLATTAFVTRTNPGVFERLPHIVVSSSIEHTPFSIGPRFVALVQDPPRIDATLPEPYNIDEDTVLAFRLGPLRREDLWRGATGGRDVINYVSVIPFTTDDFTTGGVVTAQELVDVVNVNGIGVRAERINIGTASVPSWAVRFLAHSPQFGVQASIELDVTTDDATRVALGLARRGNVSAFTASGGTTTLTASAGAGTFTQADVGRYVLVSEIVDDPLMNTGRFLIASVISGGASLTFAREFGSTVTSLSSARWFVSLYDDGLNPDRPPMHRFARAGVASVRVEIATEQSNTRALLTDFVATCFDWLIERDVYAIVGRSNDLTGGETSAAPGIDREHYQIVQKGSVRMGNGRNELPRPGDGSGKVFMDAIDINFDVVEYIDRAATLSDGTPFVPSV